MDLRLPSLINSAAGPAEDVPIAGLLSVFEDRGPRSQAAPQSNLQQVRPPAPIQKSPVGTRGLPNAASAAARCISAAIAQQEQQQQQVDDTEVIVLSDDLSESSGNCGSADTDSDGNVEMRLRRHAPTTGNAPPQSKMQPGPSSLVAAGQKVANGDHHAGQHHSSLDDPASLGNATAVPDAIPPSLAVGGSTRIANGSHVSQQLPSSAGPGIPGVAPPANVFPDQQGGQHRPPAVNGVASVTQHTEQAQARQHPIIWPPVSSMGTAPGNSSQPGHSLQPSQPGRQVRPAAHGAAKAAQQAAHTASQQQPSKHVPLGVRKGGVQKPIAAGVLTDS